MNQIEELYARFVAPDLYQLAGDGTHVTYQPVFTGGLAGLTYQDHTRVLRFVGDEIRRVDLADIGLLVSVMLGLSVDSGSTTFTLLLPPLNLPQVPGASCPVSCVGITTIHPVATAPVFELGQRATSTITPLRGVASLALFALWEGAEESTGPPPAAVSPASPAR
jgi:hypothetical protein